ncbi:hypothetical protein DNH61_06040 [Paenibacillus sambharensis]|uniref:Lipoprotein n=1 Tax=Paenibacillus sambharensis TaxID=1803190 RepID=A0A2W1LPG9_9BACL|nr:hypothetical protein [Paenibacillus sambharensis]PZD96755.1 hypothetical protein DNH61_06040 [Paenibacillus sambharensis]
MRRSIWVIAVVLILLLTSCGKPPLPEVHTADGTSIDVHLGSYCWGNTCADSVGPEEMLKDKNKQTAPAGTVITFAFGGKQPTETGMSMMHDGELTNVALVDQAFKVPAEPGVYYYSLFAKWRKDSDGKISDDASYVFAIEVKE